MLDILNTYIFGPALPIVIFGIGLILIFKYGSFIFTKPKHIVKTLTKKKSVLTAEEGMKLLCDGLWICLVVELLVEAKVDRER